MPQPAGLVTLAMTCVKQTVPPAWSRWQLPNLVTETVNNACQLKAATVNVGWCIMRRVRVLLGHKPTRNYRTPCTQHPGTIRTLKAAAADRWQRGMCTSACCCRHQHQDSRSSNSDSDRCAFSESTGPGKGTCQLLRAGVLPGLHAGSEVTVERPAEWRVLAEGSTGNCCLHSTEED